MLLKRHDVKVIVEMLMGMDIPDEEFELDELNISAICEVMNQMMGASSTALSDFLGEMVNISTPTSFEVKSEEEFKNIYFSSKEVLVVVNFTLRIEDKLESEFINVMPAELARSLVSGFISSDEPDILKSEPAEEPARPPVQENKVQTPPPENAMPEMQQPYMQPMTDGQPYMQQPYMQPMTGGQPYMQQPIYMQPVGQPYMQQPVMNEPEAMVQPEPKVINVLPMEHPVLDGVSAIFKEEQPENVELIMEVPLEISVEIGRTKKVVREILDIGQGSLIVLDKLAGDQVDLLVNGRKIAKGDVVVVNDNFGVRITDVLSKDGF